MTTGTILLIAISIVTVIDLLIAVYFRNLAERAESGQAIPSSVDPQGAARVSNLLFLMAPLMWLIVALISFGVIPSGIDPARF